MTKYRSDFLNILSERGFIHQCSNADGLDAALMKGQVTAYIGFDCTAPSLHAGSLVQIMMLYWFQQTGHRPLALMGSGTTRVGDPSGKDESRKMLTADDIKANMEGIRKVFSRFLKFGDGPNTKDALMPDNADWLLSIAYVDFLRDVGRHVSINEMIHRDSIRLRLEREQHLSFLEFNYMILQAYDFVELYRRYGCTLQMGGSDQWGNILSGIDLGRRIEGADMFALTSPLLATSSGAKMGKTADGAVWLNDDMLSAYDYWQYWRNTEDADVGRFLRLFTELPLDEIGRLEKLEGAEINEAKKILAHHATRMVHGDTAAENSAETARKTFEEGGLAEGLPTVTLSGKDITEGLGIVRALNLAGLASSNGEARRHIRGRAVRVNDTLVEDEKLSLTENHQTGDGVIKLSVGKKRHVLLKSS